MNRIVRYLMLAGAWTACIIGCIGVFVPVLPTTPLLLLATFLFAKSSPRCHAWIISTRVYRTYVAAFKEAGGIPVSYTHLDVYKRQRTPRSGDPPLPAASPWS